MDTKTEMTPSGNGWGTGDGIDDAPAGTPYLKFLLLIPIATCIASLSTNWIVFNVPSFNIEATLFELGGAEGIAFMVAGCVTLMLLIASLCSLELATNLVPIAGFCSFFVVVYFAVSNSALVDFWGPGFFLMAATMAICVSYSISWYLWLKYTGAD